MSRSKSARVEGSLPNIGASLGRVAAAIAERIRHEGQSGPFKDFEEHMQLEALRLRGEGQVELADAVAALSRDERTR